MSHTITAKLNQAARQHQSQNGTTFFVSLGEKNYDYKSKNNVWTNYEAALFAKDAQVGFYSSVLIEGAILSVSASGIIVDDSNKDYKPKLVLQDAKLEFVNDGGQQAPQQQSGYQNQQNPTYQQAAPQQGGYQQQAPKLNPQEPTIDFDDDIPFAPIGLSQNNMFIHCI